MSNIDTTDHNIPLDTVLDEGADVEPIDQDDDNYWLELAVNNFTSGKSFQDAALTNQWERNVDHFNSNHYRRSIYKSKLYQGRSRLFRPMSRAAERSASGQFATAAFSNIDVVKCEPENQNDPMQVAAAHIMQEVLAYRLDKSIPWFLTAMGAWQDTRVYGPCCTYTYWDFAERTLEKEVPVHDVHGNAIKDRFETIETTEIVTDKPVIDMVPPENLILDPHCDWRDPINTSPYAIRLVPLAVDDILAKMDEVDTKTGQPDWIPHTREEILSVSGDKYNSVRQSREGSERPDKTDSQDRPEFKVVWCHENFIRLQGQEYIYWTLGTEYLLSNPVPLEHVYLTGKRPLTYGYSIIEAHKFSPSSPTELITGLQTAVNDIANMRTDNVKLVLNKRYIIRRGAAVDLEALMRSVPGGGVTTDDPERDIKVVDTRDVTGSSYKEQERLETESNDLSGTFMGGSVQNNKSLNQTVGGMELLAEGANSISEFDIRTFVESWMKPQLELLIQYIQAYEVDDVIFHNAFDKAFKKLGYRYNLNEGTEVDNEFNNEQVAQIKNKVLNDKMTIRVNVGLGATSPQRKIDMFKYILDALSGMPEQMQRLDTDEIFKEIFAAAGYQDGSRFIKGEGAAGEKQEITEADLQAAQEQGAAQAQDQAKMAQVELNRELGMAKLKLDRELGMAKIANDSDITVKQLHDKLEIEQMKDKTRRDTAAAQSKDKRDELLFKAKTGKPGI